MKSLGAAVRISNGTPPAARIAVLSSAATPSRWLKQLESSDDEFTIAIFGFVHVLVAEAERRATARGGRPTAPCPARGCCGGCVSLASSSCLVARCEARSSSEWAESALLARVLPRCFSGNISRRTEKRAVGREPPLQLGHVDAPWRDGLRERQIRGRARGLAHDEARPRHARRGLAFVRHRRAAADDEQVLHILRHDDAIRDLIEAARVRAA